MCVLNVHATLTVLFYLIKRNVFHALSGLMFYRYIGILTKLHKMLFRSVLINSCSRNFFRISRHKSYKFTNIECTMNAFLEIFVIFLRRAVFQKTYRRVFLRDPLIINPQLQMARMNSRSDETSLHLHWKITFSCIKILKALFRNFLYQLFLKYWAGDRETEKWVQAYMHNLQQ